MEADKKGIEELVWNPDCPVAGHTQCKGSQEGFENVYLCSANARFSAQVCTIGHTCTGRCICTKSDRYPLHQVGPILHMHQVDLNPGCPVVGHSGPVASVDFSPDGKQFASASRDRLVKIWNTETGAEVSSFVGLRRVW